MKPFVRTGDKTISAAINLPNNFTHGTQTIDSRPMATFVYGPNNPVTEGIKPGRLGEIFIRISEGSTEGRARMWVAIGTTTENAEWEEITGSGSGNFADLGAENNFEEFKQTIDGSQIVTIKKYIEDFPNSSPDFLGQLAMCREEDSDFCKMYVAYDDNDGIPTWTALGGDEVGDNVVMTDKVNNFTEYNQTIAGNQIMSFVNGHEYNPGDAGIAPEHDGQFYVAFKTFDDGRRDVAIWVANKTTWVPVMIDGHDVARLGENNEFRGSNAFLDPRQYIGSLDEGRRLAGVRVIGGTVNPIVNPDCKPRMAGEVIIWNKDGTDPVDTTIFMSITGSKDGSEVSSASWRQLWNSKGGSIDTSNLAKLDEQNLFDAPQKVGAGEVFKWMATTSRGTYNPHDASSPDNMPYTAGEIYVEHWDDAGTPEIRVWIATAEADAESWHCVYDSTVTETGLAAQIVLLDESLDKAKLDIIGNHDFAASEADRLDATNEAVDALETITDNLDTALDGLTTVVEAQKARIDALETEVGPDLSETVEEHTREIADHETRITQNRDDINGHVTKIATLTSEIDDLKEAVYPADGESLQSKIAYNLSRITDNETMVGQHKIIIDENTRRIVLLEEGGTGGGGTGEKPPGYDALVNDVASLGEDVEQAKLDIKQNKSLVDIAVKDAGDAEILAQEAKNTVGLIEDTVNEHTTKIAELKTDVTGMVVDVDAAKTAAGEAKTEAGEAKAKADTNANSIVEVKETATALDTKVTRIDGLVTTTVETLETATTNIGTLQTRMTDAEADVTRIDGDIDTIEDTLIGVNANIDAAETRITSNEGNITAVQNLANGHQSELLEVAGTLGDHEARIDALEAGGGGTTPDLTALTAKVEKNKADIVTANTEIAENVTLISQNSVRITALEHHTLVMGEDEDGNPVATGSKFDGHHDRITDVEEKVAKLPTVLQADKYVVVNEEGTGLVMSSESTADVQALATFAEGAASGDALLSVKCMGGDIGNVYQNNVSQEHFCKSNFISVSPSGYMYHVYLGNIVPFDSTTIGATEVREGMLYYIANKGSSSITLEAPEGHNIFTTTQAATEFSLAPETSIILMPSIYVKSGVTYKMWTTVGVFHSNEKAPSTSYDDAAIRTLITANTDAIESNDTDITALQAKDTELQGAIDTNVTGLVNANAAITTLTERVNEAKEDSANAIGTANSVASRMTTAEGRIEASEGAITTLQTSLTNTGNDITALTGRVSPLEADMIVVKGYDARIDALEAIDHPTHPDLPPLEGNGGRYLVINEAEDAFEASGFTNVQATQMMAFGEGCQTGNALVNTKTAGGDTALTGQDISQTYFSVGNVVMGTPADGQTKTVSMGVIQPYQSAVLAATDVREGCIMTIANLGAGTLNLIPPSGCTIQDGTTTEITSYSLPRRQTVTVFPAIYDGGEKRYIILTRVGNYIP